MRPGNVVLFQLAGAKGNAGVELGFVLTCWRGIQSPKVYAGEVNVNSCVAFRAVALDLVDQDRLGGSRGIFQRFLWSKFVILSTFYILL